MLHFEFLIYSNIIKIFFGNNITFRIKLAFFKKILTISIFNLEFKEAPQPTFLEKIIKNFYFSDLTNEDINRTNFYQRKLDDFMIESGNSNNINNYLKCLKIELRIKKGNISNLNRSLQLLNKTNQ